MEQIQKIISDAVADGFGEEPATLFYIDFDDLYGGNNTFQSATISFADLPKYKYVSLFQASIQKTYYMINGDYSHLIVNGVNVDIPEGNYTYLTLSSTLLTLLNALPYGVWTMTFNVASAKYTFNNSTPGMYFTFNSNSDMGLRLGFANGTYNFSAGSLTSTRSINLQLTNVVIIQSNLVRAKAQNSINQSILMSIPDTSVVGSPVTFIHPDPHGCRILMENTGTTFTINLFDNNNRPLDIQSGCNIVLAFYVS